MQFSVLALAAFAASAAAHYNGTIAYTTEVVTSLVTVCPAATEITYGGVTYTATASETLTITNCPCTVIKPVITSSIVICSTCAPTSAPVYTNATTPYPTSTGGAVGTSVIVPTTAPSTTPIEANTGSKAVAFSGASLAGLLGLAAYFL